MEIQNMKTLLLKIAGVILIIIGVIMPAYLAVAGKITETLFGLIFFGFLAAGFLIYKLDEIVEFEVKGLKLKTLQKEIFAKAEEVKKLSEELNQDKKELKEVIKVFVESFYLTLETRNMFPPPKKIADKILKNLDILANFSVEDGTKRKKWIESIEQMLVDNLPK